jgi:hypothetical protein
MFAVVSEISGGKLAWITAVPAPTPMIGTLTLVVFAGQVTVAGTVATEGFEELRLNVSPFADAGTDRIRVILWVVRAVSVAAWGLNLMVVVVLGVTVTLRVVSATPGSAEAWMIAVPGTTPVTGTLTLLEFGRNTADDGTVAIEGLSEVRFIWSPVGGAVPARANRAYCTVVGPFMVMFCGTKLTTVEELGETVRVAVVSPIFGKLLAWITTLPGPNVVTGTVTVLEPGAKLTLSGTVAIAGIDE